MGGKLKDLDFSLALTKRYGKGYLSYSALKYALQDMKLFDMYMKGQLKMDSEALTFGSLYDCMLFTPEDVKSRFMFLDDDAVCDQIGGAKPRSTNKYKSWMDDQREYAGERKIISIDDRKKAEEMIFRIIDTGVRDKYLQGEVQFEFNTFVNGDVPVRGFLDVKGDGDFNVDSKTTMTISKFPYSVRDYGYDIQAHLYNLVTSKKDFYWAVQEKSYPYLVAVYKASDRTMRQGCVKFDTAVALVREYVMSDRDFSKYYMEGEI